MKLKNCFRPRAATIIALLWTALPAQNNVLSVGEIGTLRLQRDRPAEQRLSLQLRPGFHVNSNKPNDEYLIPLKLTWNTPPGIEAGPVDYPSPTQGKSDFSEKPLSVFDGAFQIVTHFRAGAAAAPPAGTITGKLRYQACNNRECLQPKTIELKLPYEID